MSIPQPEDIYVRTKKEGERRLERPVIEVASTAIAAGVDIVAGVTVLGLVSAHLAGWTGVDAAHVFGSIGFGVAFVFLVVGRGELFTENFLVPIAGLDHRSNASWWALARLWIISPVFNVLGGTVMILILTAHGVLPKGTGKPIALAATKLHEHHALSLFLSAVFAGALITAMTWFVEGNDSMLVRIVIAWIAGAILALGGFNHVIVITLELVYGLRFGAHIPVEFIVGNFFWAALGNMVGGIGLVTLNRLTQGKAGHASSGGSSEDD
jgi:formate/nitrite transporter FocA (FNT family)